MAATDLLAQAVRPRGPHFLDRDESAVEHAVMVRAQHHDVLDDVRATGLAAHDVRHIALRFAPSADRAARVEEPAHRLGEGRSVFENLLNSALHLPAVGDAPARPRAVRGGWAHRLVVRELGTAGLASLGEVPSPILDVDCPLNSNGACAATELRSGGTHGAAVDNRLSAVQAWFRHGFSLLVNAARSADNG